METLGGVDGAEKRDVLVKKTDVIPMPLLSALLAISALFREQCNKGGLLKCEFRGWDGLG